jgi:hypothetical protein
MRLVESTRIDYARASEPLMLDTQPRTGWAVYGVLWCDIPALDDNLTVPAVTLRMSRGSVTIPCAGRQGVPGGPSPGAAALHVRRGRQGPCRGELER